jgi:hypothetical protein
MMQSLRASLLEFEPPSPVFLLVVLLTLGFLGLIGVMLFGGILGLSERIAAMGHFGSRIHLTHDLTYAFLFGVAAVGMLAQLRTPSKNVAGQLMALIPWIAFVLAFALGNILINLLRPPFVPIFGALTLLAIILHPAWRNLFSSFSISRVNWVMLTLVIIAAVPLLIFAATNVVLQRTVLDSHAAQAHYGYMAAFSFTVIGVSLLASLRPDGWWLPAWVAGLLPVLLGLASLLLPDVTSSLGLGWALAAIAWGIVFIAAAELTQDAESPTLLGSLRGPRGVISKGVGPERGPTTSTPRWVKVLGSIALVPVLLVVINMVVGVFGGSGLHTPPGGAGGPGGHGPSRHIPSGNPGGQTPSGSLGSPIPPEAEAVRARFASYTVEQAAREGYVRDEFCLDAATLGQPAERGAMGFHATNETLLRGPIDSNRPQALLFDAQGRMLGVEYEVMTDAVSEPPRLFGQTFVKLPAHPGVQHEHYALHLWFIENPSGALADFNPSVSCLPGSTPQHGPGRGGH